MLLPICPLLLCWLEDGTTGVSIKFILADPCTSVPWFTIFLKWSLFPEMFLNKMGKFKIQKKVLNFSSERTERTESSIS